MRLGRSEGGLGGGARPPRRRRCGRVSPRYDEEIAMLLPAIPLDASMTAAQVLDRLARQGIWREASDPGASAFLAERARRLGKGAEEVARRLGRDPADFAVAIRRQL